MRKGAPSVNPNGRSGGQDSLAQLRLDSAEESRQLREDGVYNRFTGHGTTDDRRIFTRHRTVPLMDEQAIDLRRGNWLAKRLVEWLPADCFRKGYTIKLQDKETAEALMAVAESLGVNQKIVQGGQMEDTTGGAALFPVLDGALGDLSEPLDLDANPRILGIRAIHVLEPRELQPVSWYEDLENPKFRMPERYRVWTLGRSRHATGVVIHESRLAVFPGVRVSAEVQPGQRDGWGDSKLTPVTEIIHDFGLAWGSAATILHNFSERVQKVDGLMKILSQKDGETLLRKRRRAQDKARSTLRTEAIDAADDMVQQSTTVAGLPDMLVQFAQLVSGAGDIPMTRLFGMSPAGMNATGEFDLLGVHERVATEQTKKYTAIVEWLLRIILLSSEGPTGGNEPDVWSIEWKPLKQQTEQEIATTRKLVMETDQGYVDMGLPAEGVLRDRFGGDTYSMETTFDEAAFKAQQEADRARAEEVQAAMQGLDQTGAQQDQQQPKEPPVEDPAAQ